MLVKRLVYLALLQLTLFAAKAQCPQILDYLNNPSSSPMWISCTGGAYTLNFESPSNFPGTYTISWGDASPDHTGTAYPASSVIPHVYGATTGSFLVTLMIPAQTCTMTGVVVMELPVNAALSIPIGGTLAGCSPANITFSNTSTNVSSTTQFTIYGEIIHQIQISVLPIQARVTFIQQQTLPAQLQLRYLRGITARLPAHLQQ